MNQTGISLGKDCAAFACSSRSYYFVNKERKPTGFPFFTFPKSEAEINDLCNLIKKQNGKDGFLVKGTLTYICSKHLHIADMHRAPGGTRRSQIKEYGLIFHIWNSFVEVLVKSRKPLSYRTSLGKEIG